MKKELQGRIRKNLIITNFDYRLKTGISYFLANFTIIFVS